MIAQHLNYHHLQYFCAVANEGNLIRTAKKLHISQSALSSQIRQLEDQLGMKLFAREGRSLKLTEAGQITLAYADHIFNTGGEMLETLHRGKKNTHILRIGAVATLSKNFQESFITPLLQKENIQLELVSGNLPDLLASLHSHTLDLVLSNRPPPHPGLLTEAFRCHHLARQAVSLVGRKRKARFRFPEHLDRAQIILPSKQSEIRTAFDSICARAQINVRILAEVDDVTLMRLLARDTDAVAVLSSIVVRDELLTGALKEYCAIPDLYENFYAITIERQFPHPLIKELLSRESNDILDMSPA